VQWSTKVESEAIGEVTRR